jgi:hypothetical protein
VAFFHYPAAVPVHPAMGNPMGMGMRRPNPSALLPGVSMAIPSLIAWGPNVSWSRRGNAGLDCGSRGRNSYDHVGGENID